MHIPDWDPLFLSKYDPAALASEYKKAQVEGVLLYCKSHMGQNYWPSPVGGIHPAARNRDLVGELVSELKKLNIRPAAYHSVMYDNWAAEHFPEWRVKSSTTLQNGENRVLLGRRYGTCCPNNPDYLSYEIKQITSLISRYDFDALWVDMVFWTAICICNHCTTRFTNEHGLDIPTVVDWESKEWVIFQSAREEWLDDFWRKIRTAVWETRPGLPITHNFAATLGSWYNASTTYESSIDTFTGGDLYGGKQEQLVVSKMMHHISREQPAEYMSSRTPDLRYHVQLRTERDIFMQALGAVANHLSFLFIDAIDPVGTVSPGVYERMGKVFDKTKVYEPFLGGTPVEDVAVYFSDYSKMSPAEKGNPIWLGPTQPSHHLAAFHGACRALQSEHVPFGIITRGQLKMLSTFKVLVLPDVTRMSAEEIEAVRKYVADGGRVYASGGTSLMDISGNYGPEFALKDVFGVSCTEGHEQGGIVFMKPATKIVEDAVAPEEYVSWGLTPHMEYHELAPVNPIHIPRVSASSKSEVLATLTLPYGYPDAGSLESHGFASIHSSPPWTDTSIPSIIKNSFAEGQAIYSVAPIEKSVDAASVSLFLTLIRELLERECSLQVQAPEQVWVTAFEQPEKHRTVLSVLNYDEKQANLIARVDVQFKSGSQRSISSVTRALTNEEIDVSISTDNLVKFPQMLVETFDMFIINYKP
jgi:hypothetical protein